MKIILFTGEIDERNWGKRTPVRQKNQKYSLDNFQTLLTFESFKIKINKIKAMMKKYGVNVSTTLHILSGV